MGLPQGYRPPPMSSPAPIEPWRLDPRAVLALGMVSWIVCYGIAQLTVADGGIPALFLPAGIAVGLLLRLPARLWWWVLVGMVSVDVVGGTLLQMGALATNVVWGVSNVTQTLLLALLLRWAGVDMTRTRDPVIIFAAAGVVVGVVAVAGTLALATVSDVIPEQLWPEWWGGDVLSVVLVVPLVLLIGRATPPRGWLAAGAVGWLVVSLAAVTVEFSGIVDDVFPVWIWLIIGAPLVVLYSVRYGLLAMAGFLLVLDLVAVAFTAAGRGPFQQLALSDEGTPMRTLQLVLIVLAISVQSVSLLVHRNLHHGRGLAGQQALLDAVIEGSPVPTVLLDPHVPQRIIKANRAFRDLLAGAGDTADAGLVDYFPASERAAVVRLVESVDPADRNRATGEFTALDHAGRPILLRLRVAAVLADDFDKYGGITRDANLTRVVHVEDVTDVRQREDRLRRDATTDPLTGLANRRHLLHVLRASLSRAAADNVVAVAYLDLDGFKDVNDRFGHATGDRLLRRVAECLREHVRPGDLVARAGGDEFVIVSAGLPNEHVAAAQAKRLLADLVTCAGAADNAVGASMGVAATTDAHVAAEELLRRADRQMYAAKVAGGGRVAEVPADGTPTLGA